MFDTHESQQPVESVETRVCASCGTPAAGGAFCTACGTRLPEAPAAVSPSIESAPLSHGSAYAAMDAPATAHPTPSSGLRPKVSIGAIAAVVAVIGGFLLFSSGGSSAAEDVKGSFTVFDDDAWGTASSCSLSAGYDDIGEGTPVRITNESGETIGSATLTEGSYNGIGCDFSWMAPGVARAKFYNVSVGRRGEISYSYSDMQSMEWLVETSLGD